MAASTVPAAVRGEFVTMAELEAELPADIGKWSTAKAVDHLLLTRRLKDYIAGIRLAMLPSLGSTIGLLYTFRDQVPLALLLAWAGVQFVLLAVYSILAHRLGTGPLTFERLKQHWRRCMALEFVRSANWAVIFPALATVATGVDAVVLAVIAIINLYGVLMVHRTAPTAPFATSRSASRRRRAGRRTSSKARASSISSRSATSASASRSTCSTTPASATSWSSSGSATACGTGRSRPGRATMAG